MPSARCHTRNRRGSVLFLILLAVALFAALNYAVTSSMQGNTKDGSTESAEAAAAEILQWFAAVDNAVMRMKMNGIAYEDMSFGYDGAKSYSGTSSPNLGHNTRCTTNSCRVFHAEGGGVSPPNFVKYATPNPTGIGPTNLGPGWITPQVIDWPQAGTSLNDIGFIIRYIKPSICRAINNKLGIPSNIPGLTGTYVTAENISNWDLPGYYVSAAHQSNVARHDTYATGIQGSGDGQSCWLCCKNREA